MQRTRDILQRAREFHAQLSDFYAQMGRTVGREKIRMLLTYMSRHESNLAECLGQYEKDAARRVLDTWFRYSPDQPLCKCFEGVQISPDASVEDVVRMALQFDACLLDNYREMAERAVSVEVRELFQSLLKMEEKEGSALARNALLLDRET